jgi:adenylosuccinate lyase
MMKPELYVGRSIEIVERYCGAGGPVEKALAPYAQYLAHSTTAQLNV